MMPFLFYLFFSIMFIYIFLYNTVNVIEPFGNFWIHGSAGISFICWAVQAYMEVWQHLSNKNSKKTVFLNFFTKLQFFNKNDLIHLTLIIFLLILNIWGIEKVGLDIVSVLAALTIFSLFIKCYEWLRIFEKTAFYIYLIS